MLAALLVGFSKDALLLDFESFSLTKSSQLAIVTVRVFKSGTGSRAKLALHEARRAQYAAALPGAGPPGTGPPGAGSSGTGSSLVGRGFFRCRGLRLLRLDLERPSLRLYELQHRLLLLFLTSGHRAISEVLERRDALGRALRDLLMALPNRLKRLLAEAVSIEASRRIHDALAPELVAKARLQLGGDLLEEDLAAARVLLAVDLLDLLG